MIPVPNLVFNGGYPYCLTNPKPKISLSFKPSEDLGFITGIDFGGKTDSFSIVNICGQSIKYIPTEVRHEVEFNGRKISITGYIP